jgi:hypothetical protein
MSRIGNAASQGRYVKKAYHASFSLKFDLLKVTDPVLHPRLDGGGGGVRYHQLQLLPPDLQVD